MAVKQTISTTPWIWAIRGLLLGAILVAALNAVSFLFRSSSIEHLFEGYALSGAAIGFPFEIWNHAESYGTHLIDVWALAANLGVALVVGLAFAGCILANRDRLNRWAAEFEAENDRREKEDRQGIRFSLSGLMTTTTLCGFLAAAMTNWAGTRELLWFVYVLGPIALVGIAFVPRGIQWQSRCVVLTVAAVIMIGSAIWSGQIRGLDFDRVMMGVFIFWTPQSAFAAVALMIGLAVSKIRSAKVASTTA